MPKWMEVDGDMMFFGAACCAEDDPTNGSDHNHVEYALTDHDHDTVYSALDHNHDTVYAPIVHDHDQYALDTDLDVLSERVDHLETTVADHRFVISSGSMSDGMIVPLRPGGSEMLWENVSFLRIAKVDADGRPVSMEQVYPSIAIRLVDQSNSGHFVGTVDSVTDEGDYTSLGVTASHGVGAPVYGDDAVMSVFPPGGETDLSLYVTQDQLTAGLSGKAPTSHSHSYASSGHSHSTYAVKGSTKKIMQDDGTTGPVQFTVSGSNLYWSK